MTIKLNFKLILMDLQIYLPFEEYFSVGSDFIMAATDIVNNSNKIYSIIDLLYILL